MFRILRDPAAAEEAGATTTAATTAKETTAAAPDPSEGFRAALKKHGDDATALARTLYLDHEKTRADLEAARGNVPKKGSLVLDPEAAKGWSDLVSKHKPEAIAQALSDLETARSTIAATERKELISIASKAVGSDLKPLDYDAEVLAELLKDGVIELKDTKDRFGKPAKLAEVVESTTDANGKVTEKRMPLDKFAAEKWAKFLPSLKAGAAANPQIQRPSNVPPTTTAASNSRPSSVIRIPSI